jgi:hypothetical protein
MFDYLQKFNTLPQNLRDSVSSSAAMAVISELEAKYKIDLAATVMKVMTKIIPLADLSIYFVSDFSLDQESAKKLTSELKERLFFPAANYLGYNASYSSVLPKTAIAPVHATTVDKVIKESGVIFAGLDLNARFKNVLTTYIKGVRSRVDARFTLNKEIVSGGLGLDHKVIDKIFKICDELRAAEILPTGNFISLPTGALESLPKGEDVSRTGLEKIRELYQGPGEKRDIPYDLKTAISKGEIKKPIAPLNLPVPEENQEKLLEGDEAEIMPLVIVPVKENKPAEIIKPIEIPKPIIAPNPIEVPRPVEIKSNIPTVPKIPVGPMVDAISAAAKIIVPVSAAVIVPTAAVIKAINALKPESKIDAPKINRPPERKPGIFSKLFGAKSKTVPAIPVKPVNAIPVIKKEIPLAPKPSIATLRNEATISQLRPTIKAQPIVPNIKMAPKVMGPLEELKFLDLINFRRFGATPEECTAKVESKIKLLEKDGYDKMIKGVTAWHESPVNFLYLKMGSEALNKGLNLKQYILDNKNQTPENFLTWEEIEAIIALNSRLMF